jgi:hypothetical protein
MPRKFTDGELVGVHFSSRRTYAHFLGIVESYKNRKYHVRCLAVDKRLSSDVVFPCDTRELYVPNNTNIDDRFESQLSVYNRLLESYSMSTHYNPHRTPELILWASFALTRIKDRAWSRKFPITTTHDRRYDYVH